MSLVLTGHRSFTHVIQDNQFSSLGIVLVAQLAKMQMLIGSISGCKQKGSLTTLPTDASCSNLEPQIEDLGVAVGRTSPGTVNLIDSDFYSTSAVAGGRTTDGASEEAKLADSESRGIRQEKLPAESSATWPRARNGIGL